MDTGESGWIISDELDDGTETRVTWSPENERTVTVRSTAAQEAVVAAARSLQPVTADEWTAVFPDAG
jgi:hypothetical protein